MSIYNAIYFSCLLTMRYRSSIHGIHEQAKHRAAGASNQGFGGRQQRSFYLSHDGGLQKCVLKLVRDMGWA